jgi:hypothetical protein
MKLYKSENDEIFAYEEDGSQDSFIGDKTPISQEDADAIIQAKMDALSKEKILTPLEKLEYIGLTVEDLKTLLGDK